MFTLMSIFLVQRSGSKQRDAGRPPRTAPSWYKFGLGQVGPPPPVSPPCFSFARLSTPPFTGVGHVPRVRGEDKDDGGGYHIARRRCATEYTQFHS